MQAEPHGFHRCQSSVVQRRPQHLPERRQRRTAPLIHQNLRRMWPISTSVRPQYSRPDPACTSATIAEGNSDLENRYTVYMDSSTFTRSVSTRYLYARHSCVAKKKTLRHVAVKNSAKILQISRSSQDTPAEKTPHMSGTMPPFPFKHDFKMDDHQLSLTPDQ